MSRKKEIQSFFQFVIQHFIEDDCFYRASALAFTTLLAIVPLMYVGLTVLTFFTPLQSWAELVQDFIFKNFVPTTGKIIQDHLHKFTEQAAKLPIGDLIFLFITTIFMMITIEYAMNKIWRVKRARHNIRAVSLYFIILLFTPLLLGLSLAASSYIIALPLLQFHNSSSLLTNSLPFIFSLLGFTFLYVIVPNASVKFTEGLAGGFFAAILFEIAKHGFAFYLSKYNSYTLLYGAFAVIPVFFIWVYWVWVITLLGAEISYAFGQRVSTPIKKRRLG